MRYVGLTKCFYTSKRRAFTMIELVLVVLIIALLAGIGGGLYAMGYKKLMLKKAVQNFVLAARYARIKAVEQQSPCIMRLDTNEGGFDLFFYTVNEDTGRAELVPLRDSYLKKDVEFGTGIKYEKVRITPVGAVASNTISNSTDIVFTPAGTTQPAVIQIGDGSSHYTICINAATGRVKMQSGTADVVQIATVDLERR